MRALPLALATVVALAATPAMAQRAVQISPDGTTLLINKPFGGQEWSIVVNFDAQTVLGNVFNFDGSNPQFLNCTIVAPTITSPTGFTSISVVTLHCQGAEGCDVFPCSPAQWTDLGNTDVTASFFVPPGPQPQPSPVPGCTSYAATCAATSDPKFSAAGGRLCGNLLPDMPSEDIPLGATSFLSVDANSPGLSSFVVTSGIFGLIGFDTISREADGSLVLDAPNGGSAQGFCASTPPLFATRSLRHRMTITRVCNVGKDGVVLGTVDAVLLATDGSTCEITLQFKMIRQQ